MLASLISDLKTWLLLLKMLKKVQMEYLWIFSSPLYPLILATIVTLATHDNIWLICVSVGLTEKSTFTFSLSFLKSTFSFHSI